MTTDRRGRERASFQDFVLSHFLWVVISASVGGGYAIYGYRMVRWDCWECTSKAVWRLAHSVVFLATQFHPSQLNVARVCAKDCSSARLRSDRSADSVQRVSSESIGKSDSLERTREKYPVMFLCEDSIASKYIIQRVQLCYSLGNCLTSRRLNGTSSHSTLRESVTKTLFSAPPASEGGMGISGGAVSDVE